MHLSIIRQHYKLGFRSVIQLIESLEMQIEKLTLAQSPNRHLIYLERTVESQKNEIRRLNQVLENKSQQLLDSQRSNCQLQKASQSHLQEKTDLNRRWQHKIDQLQNRLTSIQQSNQQLQSKIRELEKCLESGNAPPVKLDSHNSSLPPALDPPWSKPKMTRSLRTRSGRPVGGVPGHQGFTLRQVSDPDLVIVQPVKVCQHCQYSLVRSEPIRFHKRQIFEIENGGLFVTEHQAEVKLCPLCRQISKGHFPDHIKAPVQYGASVFSRIVYLNQYQLLPVGRTAETMNDLFRCPLSWATVKRAARTCADQLLRFELKVKTALRNSSVMGVDETRININGEINWVHLARTDEFTHFAFHQKRGKVAFEEIGIINEFKGVLVRDGFLSYQQYQQCKHSLCNVHLLRDLIYVGENEPPHKGWTEQLALLLLEVKTVVQSARSGSLDCLDSSLQNSFANRYDQILTEAGSAIRGSPKPKDYHLSARSLYGRFVRNKELILRFMTDFRVPFDNNGSERDLRILKLQQKISGCFRSVEGVKIFCRVRSYLSSARKQGGGLLNAVELALNGKPFSFNRLRAAIKTVSRAD